MTRQDLLFPKFLPKAKNGKKHMKALPHGEVGSCIQLVRESQAAETTKLAFEFLVLTATRSGEVRLATVARNRP